MLLDIAAVPVAICSSSTRARNWVNVDKQLRIGEACAGLNDNSPLGLTYDIVLSTRLRGGVHISYTAKGLALGRNPEEEKSGAELAD